MFWKNELFSLHLRNSYDYTNSIFGRLLELEKKNTTMNKSIKETKSDTKRMKNVSKIATRVISDKKRAPIRGNDRSSSMNSLIVVNERANDECTKKIIANGSSEAKIVDINPNSIKNGSESCDKEFLQKFDGSSSKERRIRTQSGNKPNEHVEDAIEDPLSEEAKLKQKKQFFDQLIAKEGSVEKILNVKKKSKTVIDIDRISGTEIRESLNRVDENTATPFSFLNNMIEPRGHEVPKIKKAAEDEDRNPNDIDLQLASLVKRVELNKKLLERANKRIKDINFLAEKKKAICIRDTDYNEQSFLKIKEFGDSNCCQEPVSAAELAPPSHPAVDELQKTMNSTIRMLEYVHKMSSGDLASGEIPAELTDYLNTPITSTENI